MSDDDQGRPHLRLIGQPPSDATADSVDAANSRDDRDPAATGDRIAVTPDPASRRSPPGAWSTLHDLTGRVVLMTGHGDGLDDAIATGLADHGARLVVAQHDIERAKQTAQVASRPGSQGSIAFAMDSTRPEQVRRGVGAVEQLTGQLDALVVIIDLGRATSGRESGGGVSLGEMIHLVRATERRMAVLGGGRILILAGGPPRDPAIGAITTGAVAEFVQTTAPDFAAQGVSINGIIAALPALPSAAPPPELPRPEPAGDGEPGIATDPADVGKRSASSDEATGQTPVIPFPTAADGPQSTLPTSNAPGGMASVRMHDQAAPAIAAALLFLSPATIGLTGQVLRIGAQPSAHPVA